MSDSPNQIDDFLLDELVCGNLEGDQYRRVVRALDAQPERWKDCALAFLQEQALTKDLQAITRADLGGDEAPSRPIESDRGELASGNSHPRPAATASTLFRLEWMHKLTSLAAMVLISFTIGWYGANWSQEDTRPAGNALAGSTPENHVPVDQREVDPLPSPPSTLGELQFVDQPFVTLDRQMPASLRELERRGRVRIESVDVLMPMNLEDGTSAIVPVQQYRVTPVIYSY